NTSLALWALEVDSELLFVGDAGNTEESRGSKRKGVELTTYYRLTDQWSLDLEYAYTDAEFTDDAPEGDEIPGALEHVVQAGVAANLDSGWFGSLRLRYFGERPLNEDGSVESDPSTIWNLRVGYRKKEWTLKADILNLTDSDDHDIDYYYASRLDTEPTGVATEDIHYHVIEPRTYRVSLTYQF
ncbi:MAG: TonB-dependent receptor, partial [Candidatus Thiodiazotropha endolucinida]|nr:TonB-dependent receptor [Candidatus Thiodiazotropha taylori]MCW4241942.1 TonB-dependent receptor [Candidatus Thiodiazotropha taylori]